jgi:hypothetical protein
MDNGGKVEAAYVAGDTKHQHSWARDNEIHDLENTVNTPLVFTTVEFFDRANSPLPDSVRRN